jgi:hypothetical protein
VFRLLGFVLLLCACMLPIAPFSGVWTAAAHGLERIGPSEQPVARQAAPDEGTRSDDHDSGGAPFSSGTMDDADDLVPEQDPAEPAPVVVTVVRTLLAPTFEWQGIGPAEGFGRGTDHPPRS